MSLELRQCHYDLCEEFLVTATARELLTARKIDWHIPATSLSNHKKPKVMKQTPSNQFCDFKKVNATFIAHWKIAYRIVPLETEFFYYQIYQFIAGVLTVFYALYNICPSMWTYLSVNFQKSNQIQKGK